MARRKNPPVYIYALVDPRDQTPRYVGRSRNPMVRFSGHLSARILRYANVNRRLYGWVDELAKADLRPMLLVIEKVDMAAAPAGEQKWIDRFRPSLFNSTSNRTGLVPIKGSKVAVLGYR